MAEGKVQVIERRKLPDKKIKVAVYCRVSNKHQELEESLENQIKSYTELIKRDPRCDLVNVYHDFGISGFKENRPGFQQMLSDAENHKFELIITKSITRFSRNTDTVLRTTRRLKELGIGVYFELQNMNTTSHAGELLMTLYAAFGQAESESSRVGTKMAIKRRIDDGKAPCVLSRIFGYSRDIDGKISPDGNARWAKKIFEMAAGGESVAGITRYLNENRVTTDKGAKFYRATVERIIKNEEYKGDFLAGKHYVDEGRHLVVNTGEVSQYYFSQNHTPIVTPELWESAQAVIGVRAKQKTLDPEDKHPTYEHHLFCGMCGSRLVHRYSGGKNRWVCQGSQKFTKEFCPGVSITDDEIRSRGEFYKDIYITKDYEDKYHYEDGEEWLRNHRVKKHVSRAPELNEENYPYMNKIFCKYCGSKLRRVIARNNSVWWICDASSRQGKKFCKGIRVPDEKLKSIRGHSEHIYIGKERVNGRESYGYSSKPDKRKV